MFVIVLLYFVRTNQKNKTCIIYIVKFDLSRRNSHYPNAIHTSVHWTNCEYKSINDILVINFIYE